VLINSVLTSLVMFMMSFFEVPSGVLENLTFIDLDSTNKVTTTRRNKGYQNRV
jgi:hypothetical protein